MILPTMVKTSDDNMVFSNALISNDFILKHLASISHNNIDDDNKNKVHNGIEKISLNTTCRLSPRDKITKDTSWIDLFQRNNPVVDKMKLNSQVVKTHQDMMSRSPLTTTWADLHQSAFNIDDEVEDECLSVQLAALRMQLEEKRRRFNEEKTRRQEEWRQERAKKLQNAFYDMLNEDGKSYHDLLGGEGIDKQGKQAIKLRDISYEETLKSESCAERKTSCKEAEVKRENGENIQSSRREYSRAVNDEKQHANNRLPSSNTTKEKRRLPMKPDEIDDHPLSSLLQEFSPFSKKDVGRSKPATPSKSFSYTYNSSKEIDILPSSSIDSFQNTGHRDILDAPSATNNNVAGYDDVRNSNLSSTTTVNNENDNSALSTPYNSTYVLNDSSLQTSDITTHTYHSKPRTIETSKSPSYIEKQPISTSPTIHSVLQQIGSPRVSGNYFENERLHSHEEIGKYSTDERAEFLESQNRITVLENELLADKMHTDFDTPVTQESIPRRLPVPNVSQGVDIDFADIARQVQSTPEKASVALLQENNLRTPNATTFVVDIDATAPSVLTPQQIKRRERFLQQRQRNIEDEKKKKKEKEKAELEKKQKIGEITPKKTTKKERPKSANGFHQERPKSATSLYQESIMKRIASGPNLQESPSRKGKNDETRPPTPLASQVISTPNNSAEGQKRFKEYKGPEAYKKPSGKSNRKIIQNAITHYCLCGEVNKESKKKCLEALEKSQANYFLVLFREGLKFRSVYEYYPESELVARVYGIGPKNITGKMVIKYFKYNSGGKEFSQLETKHLSIQVDGVMVTSNYWRRIKMIQQKQATL